MVYRHSRHSDHSNLEATATPRFPSGCLPEPFAHENWRDVALLWFAWRKPWADWSVAEPVVMEAIEVGETISQVDKELVRDLTFGMGCVSVHRDGRTLIASRKHCSSSLSKLSIHDIVFTEAKALPFGRRIDDIDFSLPLTRTEFIARRKQKGTKHIIESWRTGNKIGQVSIPPPNKTIFHTEGDYTAICGTTYVSTNNDLSNGPPMKFAINLTHIVPSNGRVLPTSLIAERFNNYQTVVHDERFLVYTTPPRPTPQHPQLPGHYHLVRLENGEEIARAHHWQMHMPIIHLSRFNLFVMRNDGWQVFDLMSLQYLYTLLNPPNHTITISPDDQVIANNQNDDMWVGDPFTHTFQPIVPPKFDPWVAEDDEVRKRPDGYTVFMTEYPTSLDGVRTGERGRKAFYWRRVRCCDKGKIGKKCPACGGGEGCFVFHLAWSV
ncbi:hypothetical protein HDV00_002654 [Rhizophlyctis rosea]|nr:hypothetical protein HDV00_002654 [Rhizophlyctis rosea]